MTALALSSENQSFQGPASPKKGYRSYKSRVHLTKMKSHFRHAKWMTGRDGRRIPIEIGFGREDRQAGLNYLVNVAAGYAEPNEWEKTLAEVRAYGNPQHCDLISSTIFNPATKTASLFCLVFDFDFKRAADPFKIDGKLSWPKMAAILEEKERVIFNRVSWVVSSSSGSGLGLAIAISPTEIGTTSSFKIEGMARDLQLRLIKVFNHYGFGADIGAKGLVRWMPNFNDPERLVDSSDIAVSRAMTRHEPVVLELLRATDNHPALAYKKKSEFPELYLYEKSSVVESKLALLYLELLENHLGEELQLTCAEISARYGLAEKTCRKILKTPPPWLGVRKIGGREGYRLSVKPLPSLTERAIELIEDGKRAGKNSLGRKMRKLLKHPSLVKDGERYEWLGNVLWAVKLKGATESEALRIAQIVAEEVPDFRQGRSLTINIAACVKTFWSNRLTDEHGNPTIGSRPDFGIPLWLKHVYDSVTGAVGLPIWDGRFFIRKPPFGGLGQCSSEVRDSNLSEVLLPWSFEGLRSEDKPISVELIPPTRFEKHLSSAGPDFAAEKPSVMGSSEITRKTGVLIDSKSSPSESKEDPGNVDSRRDFDGLPRAQIQRPSAKSQGWWARIGSEDPPPKAAQKRKKARVTSTG